MVNVEIMRPEEEEEGSYEKMVLSAPAQKVGVPRPAKLRFSDDASESQLALRHACAGQ